jgi:DNA-binding NarL/FixJ family response regulator
MVRTAILLIDDHPITVDAYITILSKQENSEVVIEFTTAYSCREAYKKITATYNSQKTFQVAFVDISLPPYDAKQIYCGIDLSILIRRYFPACKIILLTMHSESLIIKKAMEQINPDGFILKNDIDTKSLLTAYKSIIGGDTYYSPSICKIHNDNTLNALNFDAIDCQILELISKKIKTKDMTEHLDLSLSAIEKRKATIKNKLLKDKGTDIEIIEEAHKIGLI